MDPTLHRLVLERLRTTPPSDPRAADLVRGACAGGPDLAEALAGTPTTTAAGAETEGTPTAGLVHLVALEVEGFRGVGAPVSVELTPGAGLVIVAGRNGSGKSSLAEALEMLLTGENRRWAHRSEVWHLGWRNRHHAGATQITAALRVAGRPAPVRVRRRWEPDEPLAGGTLSIDGGKNTGLTDLGWERALAAYRPFLPHDELGAVWEGKPTDLHDALAGILGLEDLTAAARRLADVRLVCERAQRDVKAERAALRDHLAGIEDERAQRLAALLGTRRPDPAAVVAAAGDPVAGGHDSAALATLAALEVPAVGEVTVLLDELAAAEAAHARATTSAPGRARALAGLLEAALAQVGALATEACPVCGTPGAVSGAWAERTAAEVTRLRGEADEADRAARTLREARTRVAGLLGQPPAALAQATEGVDTAAARSAWAAWRTRPDDLARLGAHAAATLPPLLEALSALREAVETERRRRAEAWTPVIERLRAWARAQQQADSAEPLLAAVKSAEQWLKDETGRLRDERFAPIASEVQEGWALLRQDSSVALGALRLEGSGPRRRLGLEVTIDGAADQALAVMSQGELNALALSLFLPRAMLPESPFRFIVIDDPVQAMDPRRVEGLARLLEKAARTHQVVVLTHDDRLTEAVRHLGIDAQVHELQRRERSTVEVRIVDSPVRRHLDDARAIANDRQLPVAAGRIVPGFLRQAVEAAAAEVVLRQRLARGATVADVEDAIGRHHKLVPRLALALFDDASRTDDVYPRLDRDPGPWAAGVVRRLNRGSHGGDGGDMQELCREVTRLCRMLTKDADL